MTIKKLIQIDTIDVLRENGILTVDKCLFSIIPAVLVAVKDKTNVNYDQMRNGDSRQEIDAAHIAMLLLDDEVSELRVSRRTICNAFKRDSDTPIQRARVKLEINKKFRDTYAEIKKHYEGIICTEYDKEIPF